MGGLGDFFFLVVDRIRSNPVERGTLFRCGSRMYVRLNFADFLLLYVALFRIRQHMRDRWSSLETSAARLLLSTAQTGHWTLGYKFHASEVALVRFFYDHQFFPYAVMESAR